MNATHTGQPPRAALTLLATPQRRYRACPDSQRKLLNALIFTKITVDTDGVTGEQLAEPFDTLVPLGRYYTLPDQQPADAPETDTNSHHGTGDDDQPTTALTTTALASASSNKHQLVPPAGLEPALPPPEAGRTLIITF